MKSRVYLAGLALVTAASAWALNPVAFRLASLPASAQPGQKLMLCAANIGTGSVEVTLEFINVKTGGVVAEKTVKLEPLGAGVASQPCLGTAVESAAAAVSNTGGPMAASFAAGAAAAPAAPEDGETLMVGAALVRKPLLSFREAQVTASIQVMSPDADGVMRTVETIPLGRTAHPSDGAPLNAPAASSGAHHK